MTLSNRQPRIEVRPRDIRPGVGAMLFSVQNLSGAHDFMKSLDHCKPVRLSVGLNQTLKAFEWSRIEKFLAYAEAQGVEVVRP